MHRMQEQLGGLEPARPAQQAGRQHGAQAGAPLTWRDAGWCRQRRLQGRSLLGHRCLALPRRRHPALSHWRRGCCRRGGIAAAPLCPPPQRAHGAHQRAAAPHALRPLASTAAVPATGRLAAGACMVPQVLRRVSPICRVSRARAPVAVLLRCAARGCRAAHCARALRVREVVVGPAVARDCGTRQRGCRGVVPQQAAALPARTRGMGGGQQGARAGEVRAPPPGSGRSADSAERASFQPLCPGQAGAWGRQAGSATADLPPASGSSRVASASLDAQCPPSPGCKGRAPLPSATCCVDCRADA